MTLRPEISVEYGKCEKTTSDDGATDEIYMVAQIVKNGTPIPASAINRISPPRYPMSGNDHYYPFGGDEWPPFYGEDNWQNQKQEVLKMPRFLGHLVPLEDGESVSATVVIMEQDNAFFANVKKYLVAAASVVGAYLTAGATTPAAIAAIGTAFSTAIAGINDLPEGHNYVGGFVFTMKNQWGHAVTSLLPQEHTTSTKTPAGYRLHCSGAGSSYTFVVNSDPVG